MAFIEDLVYRSILQIWSITPDMTAEKAKSILLEEEKRINHSGWAEGNAFVTQSLPVRTKRTQGKNSGRSNDKYCD